MARPLTNLLIKDAPFVIDDAYVKAFEKFQSLLVSVSIVQPPNFSLSFNIMSNTSHFAIRDVLGQKMNRCRMSFIMLAEL